jgi:hypothetical protein
MRANIDQHNDFLARLLVFFNKKTILQSYPKEQASNPKSFPLSLCV